jgi:hypothetical protein
MLTAQERKEFRRVQQSRDIGKTRAVRRGEQRRRLRERPQEVDRSRDTWRAHALAAAHRVAQRAMEKPQRKNAALPTHQLNAIDTTDFF